jgi:hypothetical protein
MHALLLCLCCPTQAKALQLSHPSYKESYQMAVNNPKPGKRESRTVLICLAVKGEDDDDE